MAAIDLIIFLALLTSLFGINAVKQIPTYNHFRSRHNKVNKNILKKWEFELDEKLEFPRGDKEKLRKISSLWSNYYACSSQLARSAAAATRLPSVAVAAYEGAIARLPCGLCVAPDLSAVQWSHQKQDLPFRPMILNEHMVVADSGNLSIFKVRLEDAGAYKCTIGQSAGGVVLLHVIDRNEPYNVVKPPTSRGPYPASDQLIQFADLFLTLFTSWDAWSECSVCEHVGRRRRYGLCYLKASNQRIEARNIQGSTSSMRLVTEETDTLQLFKDFPGGIPCRSRHLPLRLRNVPAVVQRRNEIMIGLCKVQCKSVTVFEVRSSNGELLERANNTAGVYSLSQRLPPDPPSPVFESIFAIRGQKLILVCPGTSLRDIPVTWRVGTKMLVPREVDKASGGRVHLTARDDIYFTKVTHADVNLYSCWQNQVLVGAVKLSVWAEWTWRRAALLVTLVTAALVLRALDAALRRQRRRAL